jgi:hypothetical protein
VRWPSRLLGAGLAAASGVAAVALRPGGPEAWARHAAPALAEIWVPLGDAVPWPWTPPLAALLLVTAIVLARRARGWAHAAARLLGLALLVAAGFEATWGLHGGRPSAPVRLGLVVAEEGAAAGSTAPRTGASAAAPSDAEAFRRMAARLPALLARDVPAGPLDEAAAFGAVRAALRELAAGPRLPTRPKRLPGPLLGPWGVAGVISPWTLELHVDGGLPAWSRTAVAAHELAHLAGFAGEGDAEFVGLLAALRADHPHARYAGALRAWSWLPAPLRDPASLPARARADLHALRAAQERRMEAPARVAWTLYDRWLRVRGQEVGTGGYAQGPRWLARAGAAGWW